MSFFRSTGDDWSPMSSAEQTKFLEQITPIDGKYRTDPKTSQVFRRALPYYNTHELLVVCDTSWVIRDIEIFYLRNTENDQLYRLNGTSPPIHEVNSKDPITLTDENVLFYVSFFCFFVRGGEGPFLVIDNLNIPWLSPTVLDWSDKKMVKEGRPTLRNAFRAPRYLGMDDEQNHRVSAMIYYSNAVFVADFLVKASGMVEMINEDLILADLPQSITALIA